MPTDSPESLSPLVARSLAALFERVRRRVRALVDLLSTEQLWQRPFPYGNSIGHLLLHLTGNLSYYIGAQIAGTGYVRDRPREFADTTHRDMDDVVRDFERAVDMVLETLAAQREEDWRAAYRGAGADDITDRLSAFLQCATHADHHAGQIIYLCKQLALGAVSG